MPKRDTNPGGYIGEAMRDAKRVRKPRQLVRHGRVWADCWETNGLRGFDVYQTLHGTIADARRLSAWLTRAAEWIQQEERDGR